MILSSLATMILCMTFPITLESGFIFDLRYIPFIIVALFGGYKMILPLYIILNIIRFLIGGNGIIQSFLFSTVIFLLLPVWRKWFIKQPPQRRIIYAALASFSVMALYLWTLSWQVVLDREFWSLVFQALTHYIVVTISIMLLLEKIIANIKARETMIHSEKLQMISELSASVAHEIRNPLTVTNGFLQLLQQSQTITPTEKQYVEYSLQELERAEHIVSDFLAFAKPQSENMVYSNFKHETEYVQNIMIPYANMHQVDIQYTFANSLQKHYDKNQICQCLINLYKNGIEAMKESGGTLFIDVFEKRNKIMIQIKDTGTGMTKEEVSQLGKPYYSTKKEGTGLGMLMVYSTIHKMKGKIEVESEKGKGTTFFITIPV
jgi:two-component system, sporulation sensor kinase B